MSILVTRSSMPEYDEYCAEIRELWDSHWLTNMGVKHKTLEAELKSYLDTPNLTLVTNGHLALENMIEVFGLRGEIITTPFTFASTTHAITRCGCTPAFCDIKPDDYTLDPEKLEALITDKTVAILPVHVYGNLCDTEAIDTVAKKHGLTVLYDAAHAFGVTKDGVSAANFGDASIFSFHATKVFNTIEGGAVCYGDSSLVQKFNDIKNFGIHSAEEVPFVGGNAKMNEFCAAMGICNLRHLDAEIAKRKRVVERYNERLSGIEGIRLCAVPAGVQHNYAYYPVVFDGYKYSRDEVFAKLGAQDITARKYFYPLTNSFDCYRKLFGSDPAATPVAQHIAESVLTLPLYADLALSDADRICDIILK